jgi:hypothetical protein
VGRVKTAIKEACHSLYAHLHEYLHTGFTFSYRPPSETPPWDV